MAIDSLKVFLNMGFSLVNVVGALSDGFQLTDLGTIISAAKSVPGGLASAPKALAQYLEMTDEEALPLEDWVVQNFNIANDSVEVAIESVLKVVIELHAVVRMLVPKGK